LVGIAALLIATKYEEIYPPTVKEFIYLTDDTFTRKEVLEMERKS
jgi:cyclin B